MMKTILLSVKPEYANKILSGEKRYEYRKMIPKLEIGEILFYSTVPEKKVVAKVKVTNMLVGAPSDIWNETKEYAGISESGYFHYFNSRGTAYAYVLGRVEKYNPPKELSDFNINTPPQSFVYIDTNTLSEIKEDLT